MNGLYQQGQTIRELFMFLDRILSLRQVNEGAEGICRARSRPQGFVLSQKNAARSKTRDLQRGVAVQKIWLKDSYNLLTCTVYVNQ